MGGSELDKTSKEEPKTQPATNAQSSTTSTGTVNAEWSGFQAYSPIPPHGFLASSPQAPPYMWGVQHIMPPYGTPPHPYVAMYPHGVYAHPSIPPGSYPFSPFAMHSPNGIAEASGNTPGSMETDVKPSEVKDKLPIKRSKGSLGSLNMITGKNNELGKTSGTSANGGYSKSAESGSEGTSEGSDANSENDSQLKSGGRQNSMEEASQNGNSAHGRQNGGPNTSHSIVNKTISIVLISSTGAAAAVPGPATNLHIGMDYWGAPASSGIPAIRGKVPSTPVAGGIVTAGSRDNLQSQPWLQVFPLPPNLKLNSLDLCITIMVSLNSDLQKDAPVDELFKFFSSADLLSDALASSNNFVFYVDVFQISLLMWIKKTCRDERELKRQRRKQSNRESARRSRLRKQAECDELAQRADALKEENANLRSEVSRIKSEYEQLLAENASLKERVGELPGHEDVKSGKDDQHLSNDGQAEVVQGSSH
ncbi:hypothetical protein SLEP1_g9163 [Rubroshorea leprosula]|uniref:BZIP domain-containing protein n=1 Tax=Rubroshorea leprosula TaxID=152421 RepID=A0AAV5IF96_9ROSI|nr:hypothetical protein SLEP1_g9163 [Rubroshorea leprosula]